MTTYNTGNPIGSKDPRDLYDNAENLDVAVNDDEQVFIDRLGVQRTTLWQMLEYSKQFNDRGNWASGTPYARRDYFTSGGITYVTLNPHTSTSIAADLAAGNIAVFSGNSGAMDFLQAGTGAVKRSVESKLRDVVSVKDFGAVGDGATDDTAAIQAAVNSAIQNTGNLYVPAGKYLISNVNVEYPGGLLIFGSSCNSIGKSSIFIQKSIEFPAFNVNAINFSLSGLSFTVWAGNTVDENGDPIIAISATADSITLSADPWPNSNPVIWSLINPYVVTDGTSFNSGIRLNLLGGLFAAGATKNQDGTVTLTGVKGSDGSPNSIIPNTVGYPVGSFISLAYNTNPPANPNSGVIHLSVKENHFYDRLWFNQVHNAFTLSALGSGSGPGVGVGSIGFMSNIVIDQGLNFIRAGGNINSLQIVNSQFYGCNKVFYAPYGSIESITFNNNQLIFAKLVQANNNINGCNISGNNFNAVEGFGYSDLLINIGGAIRYTGITSNNFGRSTTTVINTTDIASSNISNNNIISNSEGGGDGWLVINGNATDSLIANNNFSALYVSSSNRIHFTAPNPTVTNTFFGDEFIGKQGGKAIIGYIKVATLLNGWSNVLAGTAEVSYYKSNDGFVHVRGAIAGGSINTVAFVLPAGYRPKYTGNRFVAGAAWNGSAIVPMMVTLENGEFLVLSSVVGWSNINLSFPTF